MEKVEDKAGFPAQNNIKGFDLKGLYSLEIITDMVAGQVQILRPVNEHGVRDVSRPIRFLSSATVNAGMRPYTVQFEIPAKSLDEALAKFAEESTKACMLFLDKLESDRIKQSLAGQRTAAPLPGSPKIHIPPH